MPQHALTITSLAKLDGGKVEAALDHEIRQIIRDVIDRPGDKAKRKAILQIEAVPILDKDTGQLDTVGITCQMKSSTPVRKSIEYPMLPTNSGKLLFQELSPTNPRQNELPYEQRITPPMQSMERPGPGERINKDTGEVMAADDSDDEADNDE